MIKKLQIFNANGLKILACVAMVIDHVGLLFFPTKMLLRKIGRLALPLFTFLLAEGCKYTKDKKKHFLLLLFFASVCQFVYDLFAFLNGGEVYVCILVSLLLAELCIFALQYFKRELFKAENSPLKKALSIIPFLCAVGVTAFLCEIQTVDYGFAGCMLPVFVSLCDFKGAANTEGQVRAVSVIDTPFTRYLCFIAGLLFLYLTSHSELTEYAFFALIPVALYNGEKGKLKLKYFFYFFYPLHLVALEALYLLLLLL